MGIRQFNDRRVFAVAVLGPHLTAVTEIAVVGHRDRVRDLAGDAVQLIDLFADDRLEFIRPMV